MTNQKAMQLIQAAQAGDEAAFQDIFEAFRGLVIGRYTCIMQPQTPSNTIGNRRVG